MRNEANHAKKGKTDGRKTLRSKLFGGFLAMERLKKSSDVNSAPGGGEDFEKTGNPNMYEGRVRMPSRPLGRWSDGETRGRCRMLSLR